MNTLGTVIVDDESLARKGLRLRLSEFEDLRIVSECANGKEALQAVTEFMPDLMFLDIQMPGMSGFDVVSQLQQDNLPMVVFVTAYDEYAIEAFDVHAIDYLLKPIEPDRLKQAVERARNQQQQKDAVVEKRHLLDLVIGITGKSETSVAQLLKDHTGIVSHAEKLAIKDGGQTALVLTRDIDWIDAAGDYMCIHANNETHIMRITMKDLETRLDPSVFQRVHRSTIVNLNRVTRLCSHMNGEYYLVLANDQSIKMSRTYRDKVQHFL